MLLFTNPDKDGFWDAVRFCDQEFTRDHACSKDYGVLIGDPINDIFAIFVTGNGGENWERWNGRDPKHLPKAAEGESLFAASNEAAVVPGSNGGFGFVTGGREAHLYFAQPHSPFDTRL